MAKERSRIQEFQYEPLDLIKEQIRVISIDYTQEGFLCSTKTVSLRSSSLSFVALSYTWGSRLPLFSITIDGKDFRVRQNLYDFLCHFRLPENQYLWVDQIGIDQSNVLERNHQVELMSSIYQKASEVLVWPGIRSSNSTRHQSGTGASQEIPALPVESMADVLGSSPYWSRLVST
jgi:Heterokaryon incompatibility protein (HET)